MCSLIVPYSWLVHLCEWCGPGRDDRRIVDSYYYPRDSKAAYVLDGGLRGWVGGWRMTEKCGLSCATSIIFG